MPFFFFDPTFILILPALALALWAQFKVKSTYARFAQVGNRAGLTGYEVARLILRDADIEIDTRGKNRDGRAVGIEAIGGELTDHYDPRSKTLRLSEAIYHGRSVAALGIAAHEVGHAIQHANAYSPLVLRNVVYPVCSIGSTLAFPIFLVGLFMPVHLGQIFIQLALLLFGAAVFFTVLTLPVEFDASRRALLALANGGYLTTDEMSGARKVLRAAAMTYVAAAAMAIMQLVRMMLIANRR